MYTELINFVWKINKKKTKQTKNINFHCLPISQKMYDEIETVKAKEKQMKVLRNGNSSQLITVKLASNIKFSDIQRALEEKIDFRNCKKLRLFTEKGVEIYQDDLEYLKDGTHLYASKGK